MKERATIYCVCDQVCEELCKICEKRIAIKADIKLFWAGWPKKVTRRDYGAKSD